MKTYKFDKQTIRGLESMGSTITEDGETATIAGEMEIGIIQSTKDGMFLVQIILPNGTWLMLPAHANRLFEMEDEEA